MNKYKARRTRGISGRTYASRLEARRALALSQLERAGVVRGLREQVPFVLEDGEGRPYLLRSQGYPNGRKAKYIADFVYEEHIGKDEWRYVIEDAKGFDTPLSRLKRAVVERMTGVEVRITTGAWQRSARPRAVTRHHGAIPT